MPALPLGVPARHGAIAVALGLLGAAAFPPIGLWPFSLVALALFLLLLRDQDVQTARNLGLVYGLVYGLSTMYWLFAIFGMQAIPLVAIMAGYFGVLATLIALTRAHRPWLRVALVAMFAVAIEWVRGDAWYLRFPWYTPAHALTQAPAWIAPTRWLGTYGFAYLIWAIAAAGAFRSPFYWAAYFLLPVALLLLPNGEPPDRRVLLAQTEAEESIETLIAEIPAEKVDLAVLPEYAYVRSPGSALASSRGPAALARKVSAPVVFGAVDGDYFSTKFLNLAVVIDETGAMMGTFVKQRPVPLMHDGVAGSERPVFPFEQGVLGVAICYDLDAPAIAAVLVRSGATVFVVPTFDAMSWTYTQHVHHELLLRLRAVENDRWILRSASSGRSEVINPLGQPSAAGIDIGQVGFILLPFGHRHTLALGGQLAFLGPVAAAGTLVFILMCARQRYQQRVARMAQPNRR